MDSSTSKKRVCVVVLGDIGRSPRMQYHSLSLLKEGYMVDVVGYNESRPLQALTNHDNCHIHGLSQIPTFVNFTLMLKFLWQSWNLFFTLLFIETPSIILVQNPPSVPTLPVVWLYSKIKDGRWIIDWHNLGFSIMAMNSSAFFVNIYKKLETQFGVKADDHLCVTQAFQKHLKDCLGIQANVLYDQPSDIFKPLTDFEKCHLFADLAYFKGIEQFANLVSLENGEQRLANDMVLVMSSTSWTEDEDFSILLQALKIYDEVEATPKMLCVITGKGPMKDHYRKQIIQNSMKKVIIVLPWLEVEDYPRVVASADLGVCLHTSSSGLDLPMKVVDMFGTYLPVCAFHYETLNELVQHDFNGLHFKSAEELAQQMIELFKEFPKKSKKLELFKQNLSVKYSNSRWDSSWKQKAKPLFDH